MASLGKTRKIWYFYMNNTTVNQQKYNIFVRSRSFYLAFCWRFLRWLPQWLLHWQTNVCKLNFMFLIQCGWHSIPTGHLFRKKTLRLFDIGTREYWAIFTMISRWMNSWLYSIFQIKSIVVHILELCLLKFKKSHP